MDLEMNQMVPVVFQIFVAQRRPTINPIEAIDIPMISPAALGIM